MILLDIIIVLVIVSVVHLGYYYTYGHKPTEECVLTAPKDIAEYVEVSDFLEALQLLVVSLGTVLLWLSTPITFILAVLVRTLYKIYLKIRAYIEVYVLKK